jgi:hypothetical protein
MAITRSDELRHSDTKSSSRVIAIIIRSLNNILLDHFSVSHFCTDVHAQYQFALCVTLFTQAFNCILFVDLVYHILNTRYKFCYTYTHVCVNFYFHLDIDGLIDLS